MEFQFKIYNKEVIDCSTCHNTIYPRPESREVLLEVLLRVSESDVVSRIAEFNVQLDDIELQSPRIYGADDKYDMERDNSEYTFQTGSLATKNKLSGLFVENENDAKERIKNLKYFRHQYTKKAFYMEPGLEGIQKAINYIKLLYDKEQQKLPPYLKDFDLKYFSFSINVIWGMDERYRVKDGICDRIDTEHDYLNAGIYDSKFGFGFGNFGGESIDIYTNPYYLEHLDKIQEILDEIAPGIYEADPYEREELLQAGFLRREERKHAMIPREEAREMELRYDEIMSEKIAQEFKEKYGREMEDP
ncbi:MAG: hypothetical protein JSV62_05985 [Promethearchaeota archaeon]|nr:MAG: hypothetical protein JSV62_05985 [Candidatus Lokiarchaeota archaeon]